MNATPTWIVETALTSFGRTTGHHIILILIHVIITRGTRCLKSKLPTLAYAPSRRWRRSGLTCVKAQLMQEMPRILSFPKRLHECIKAAMWHFDLYMLFETTLLLSTHHVSLPRKQHQTTLVINVIDLRYIPCNKLQFVLRKTTVYGTNILEKFAHFINKYTDIE